MGLRPPSSGGSVDGIEDVPGLQAELDARATDAELTAETDARTSADTAHVADTTNVHGIVDTTALATAASVTSEANTRAAADTALDGRVDTLEAGGTLPAPTAPKVVLVSEDGESWTPKNAGLTYTSTIRPQPRRQSAMVVPCDDLAGVTSTVSTEGTGPNTYGLDTTKSGAGTGGSIRLTGPGAPGGFSEVVVPFPSSIDLGDGTTPNPESGQIVAIIETADDRDIALTSCGYARLAVGSGGFTNAVYWDVGKPVAGDGSPKVVRSSGARSRILLPPLNNNHAFLPPGPLAEPLGTFSNSASIAPQHLGSGLGAAYATADRCRLRVNGVAPAVGTYEPPEFWLHGFVVKPLPPYAVATLAMDWTMPDHPRFARWLYETYGIKPLLNCFVNPFRGTQGSTEMDLDELLAALSDGCLDTSLYEIQNTASVDGNNDFGGGDDETAGVAWSEFAGGIDEVEALISEAQAYFVENGIPGEKLLFGQFRKVRGAAGMALKRKYAVAGLQPHSSSYLGTWPHENEYQIPAYMIDTSRDSVDLGGGVWGASDSFKRLVDLHVLMRGHLHLLVHAVTWDGSGTGWTPERLAPLFDYMVQADKFDGITGKMMGFYESLALTRFDI